MKYSIQQLERARAIAQANAMALAECENLQKPFVEGRTEVFAYRFCLN